MTGESSPEATDVDFEAKSESDGLIHSLEAWIAEFVGRSVSKANVSIGSGIVVLSLLIIAGGVASYAYALQLPPGTDRYWLAIEAAYGAGPAGVPFLLAGVTVLSSSSKRLRMGAGIGTVTCLSAVGQFALAFPAYWQFSTQAPTFWVSGLYGIGLVFLVLCAGIAVGGRRKPDRQRPDDRTESESPTNLESDSETSQYSEEDIGPSVGDNSSGGGGPTSPIFTQRWSQRRASP